MDLRQASIFIAVAENQSFSKAARSLRLTQPAVSLQIKSLEQHYQSKLFNRSHHGLHLTSSGKIYFRFAKNLIAQERECKSTIMTLKGEVSGELKIGASGIPGEYLLPKILPGFIHSYPRVSVRMHISNTSDIIQNILKQDMDIGCVGYKIPYKGLRYKIFDTDELVLLLPKRYIPKGQKTVSLHELVYKDLILHTTGSGIRMMLDKLFQEAGLTLEQFNVVAEMNGVEAIKRSVDAGLGFSLLSKWAVDKDRAYSQSFRSYQMTDLDTTRHVYTVVSATPLSGSPVHAFLNFLDRLPSPK